ncbi:MAG: hypothetical protein MZV63_56895 [Marinilabiliales bacterium]|nr:hypothetical protein [Marinilabiliales bacterium]
MTVEIGSGTAGVGSLATINWASGPYYLKTETDPSGGTNYTITGTSQVVKCSLCPVCRFGRKCFQR